MRSVGILFNAKIGRAEGLAQELVREAEKSGVSAWLCPALDEAQSREYLNGTDMVMSLGGDGTMLRAARLTAPQGIPVLGINLGNWGFTTELEGEQALSAIPEFLAGKGWIDERVMLQVELPSRLNVPALHALNDVVVARGASIHVVHVRVLVDGEPVAACSGDGVIVATATGSTAYSLAAGGPVFLPDAGEFVLTPVAPYAGLRRSLVLTGESDIELEVHTTREARASVDGQTEFDLRDGDKVKVGQSPYITRLLRLQPRSSYYNMLLEKLSGKDRAWNEG
ncbi:MAG: NAD(+)/NADH kinase [Dehalococcoidia bacterium]